MKVLLNAISVKEGGPLVLLKHLVKEMAALRPDIFWHIVVSPKAADASELKVSGIQTWVFPWTESSPLHNCWFYAVTLPLLARRLRPDVIFSMTNYISPARGIPTLLLVQHAGYFSETFKRLYFESYPGLRSWAAWHVKSRRVKRSVLAATLVTVQTAALAGEVCRKLGIAGDRVAVISHGTGACEMGAERSFPANRPWRIGYLTHYGVQKNFDDLFRAIAILREGGRDITLVLTLDEKERQARKLLERACELGVTAGIENHGYLPAEQMQMLYDSLDIFVFPSLCESFGFPMLEAMARGLPLVVADVTGNLEIGGEAALVYRSGHPDELAARLVALMDNASFFRSVSHASLERSRCFSWRKTAAQICSLISTLAEKQQDCQSKAKSLHEKTSAHYNEHPLEFLTSEDEARIDEFQPKPFRRFVETFLHSGERVADVGCGPGRATLYLCRKGLKVVGVDLSEESLRLARQRAPSAGYICANNVELPFANEVFDAVVSDGVIHHTPDAHRAFIENARLVHTGGYLYVAVYKRWRYYYYLYTYAGVPVRWLAKRNWGRAMINVFLLPVYYLAHLVKSHGKRTWAGAKNFFYDYIVTPRATFHAREEVCQWAVAHGLEEVEYDRMTHQNCHAFVFRKFSAARKSCAC